MKPTFKLFLLGLLMVTGTLLANKLGWNSPDGVQTAGLTMVALPLKNTIAESEMIKNLRHEHTWASEIKSKQNWVNQDTIKIPKQGKAPKVLINNTNYPIVKNGRDDSHVIISLHKFDTENTTVTLDELYASPYDKTSDVQQQHRETLEDETLEYGLWGLGPQENDEANNLFILQTTGALVNGRRKLIAADLRVLQEKMNTAKITKKGRILILADHHVTDLLNEDKQFTTQYHNHKEGAIMSNFYGFKVYEDSTTPQYDASLEKLPYDSLTTGRKASVVFYSNTTAKAAGTVTRFAREATADPENRQHTIGFQLYHIIVAYGIEGSAAIVSATA